MTTEVPADVEPGRPLRADAERNRRRIITAAHELFAERGLDVSLDDVAAAAGVGVGTVYRRFANRDELIVGVFTAHLEDVERETQRVLAEADPWDAVVSLATTVCAAMAEDRGLAAIIMEIDHCDPTINAVKSRLVEAMQEVFDRAQSAGVLRPDAVPGDLYAVFAMVAGFAKNTHGVAPGVWRRYLELFLEGLHADSGNGPLGTPALTSEQISEVQRLQREARRPR